jgi:hypothetical protein
MKAQIPRDAIVQNLPIPETTTIGTPDKSLGVRPKRQQYR